MRRDSRTALADLVLLTPLARPASVVPVNFDRVAPFYRRLETLVFGDQLQAARMRIR